MMTIEPTILVAGASGYIGKAIIPKLLDKFPKGKIIALSRSQQSSDESRVTWKACDLFSLRSLEEAIPEKVDLAIYLVHSMGPTAHLDQGSFADYDLILADNFARALSKREIKQLIYLGGLIPKVESLSLHLQSRLEVEETFHLFSLPTTVFRAGLILGSGGSSFQILLKLVKHLPMMICPQWTQTLTTPVDLLTVLESITESALDMNHVDKTYDLAGCLPLTYLEMMRETAKSMGIQRYFISVPFFSPTLSRLWVSLITNTSKELVYPLIESLQHPMVAREGHLFAQEPSQRSYADLLNMASTKTLPGRSFFRFRAREKTVRSLQRLPLPQGKNAEWIKNEYVRWLPKFMSPWISVEVVKSSLLFKIFRSHTSLLELELNQNISDADRQLLYIKGGLLAASDNMGRLEFRVVLRRKFVLAAIHDYKPSLPWFIYKYSQAIMHLVVMRSFDHHLLRTQKK